MIKNISPVRLLFFPNLLVMKKRKRKYPKIKDCGGKRCGSNWAGATKLITTIKIAA